MRRSLFLALPAAAFSASLLASSAAYAVPSCAQLATDPAYGLAGNPTIVSATSTLVPAAGQNAAYCRVDFTVSERGGPKHGYAEGEKQAVVLRVGLPLNSDDGGTGGFRGAWNGKVRNLGGGSLVGNVGQVTAATNTGYVGSSTDSGHTSAENPGFGVIQATNQLNIGKINDFFHESLRHQYQWALRLAASYYGTRAQRNYWDGCSTGGRQGLVLAWKHGDDFDGFLVGAPHTSHTKTSSASVWRQWVNKDVAGGTVTTAKHNAAVAAAIAACDAQDGVADGMLRDPRTCTFSASANVCGQPGAPAAPNCLTPGEAKAIDMVWDGARNDKGTKVWPSGGRAAVNSMQIGDNCGNNAVMCWIQKDMTSDWRTRPLSDWDNLIELGARTLSPHVDMRSTDLDRVKRNGGKILMWHGGSDPLINWEQTSYYYRQVANEYGGFDKLSRWFRFFLAPGVGHCGGGVGPQPQALFDTMVKWVEKGDAPDSILSSGGGRTRPLCAWPQTAVYSGNGSTDDAANFHCGSNLDTKEAICENYLIARYQHETSRAYDRQGLPHPSLCHEGHGHHGDRDDHHGHHGDHEDRDGDHHGHD
jgi:Tannase and feruloyl esterase